MQEIFVFNTLTKKKECLVPITSGVIKMYACGVTVYDHCHIGHAVQAIVFDVIKKYLEYIGYKVIYVRNYTDVDDKIINRAKELGIPSLSLSSQMISSAEEDMKLIGCDPPTYSPKVSEMIPEIIKMITTLINKQAAYVTKQGDVYYRVSSKPDYGKLSKQNITDMITGTRDIIKGDKENELDFALWKHDDVSDVSWDSPWGRGRPGWHIECSVMSEYYLGKTFDIHGGGRDLIFPHHENEIAQSESANEVPLCNYWLHSGLLTVNKQKMSKSLKNHIYIKDFIKDYPSEVLRYSVLQHHYSSNIDFSKNVFDTALKRLLYYYTTLYQLQKLNNLSIQHHKSLEIDKSEYKNLNKDKILVNFHKAMSDDFNTSLALADLNNVFKKINDIINNKKLSKSLNIDYHSLYKVIKEVFGVLGLLKEEPIHFIQNAKNQVAKNMGIDIKKIEDMILQRNEARKFKNYALADDIRKQLLDLGIEIMDSKDTTEWSIKFN